MSHDPQELELQQRLRQVLVPTDLRQQLLQIPDLCEPGIEPDHSSSHLHSRRFFWLLATAAGVAGLIGFSIWWLTAINNDRQQRPIVQQPPTPSNATRQSESTPPVDAQREQLAQLQQLKQQMLELENSLADLEQQEQSLRRGSVDNGRQASASTTLGQDLIARTLYSTAETNTLSGIKTPTVKSQLEFVVQHFPQTPSAQQAQALLTQF